jgi:hypothetical protein
LEVWILSAIVAYCIELILTARVLVKVCSPEDRQQKKNITSLESCDQSTHFGGE